MATTELSADTRARILDTAWRRVRDHGTGAVSVKAIAQDAGVSRQLVYFHYHNRAGLLLAMARHRDEASGFRRQAAEARRLAPVDALEALLRAWCAYLPELLPVARALEAALITGDEGGEAWTDRMDDLHRAYRLALDRIAQEGRLAAAWTVESATDWAWAHVQPDSWAHLVDHRGWTADAYTERTVRTLLDELVAPAETKQRPR